MGIIKGLASALKDKAKEELLDYLKKIVEEDDVTKGGSEEPASIDTAESDRSVESEIAVEAPEVEQEEWIPPIVQEPILKISIGRESDDVVLNRRFASDLQSLNLEEFSVYMKLLFVVFRQKKNYGYMGNALRKKLELKGMSSGKFGSIALRLEKRGLVHLEKVSDTQTTYVLYIPFDESCMKHVEEPRQVEPKKAKAETHMEKPGSAGRGMDEDALIKSYRTFVALEIDKAKMRVGRSNFDKIYMEGVKYIDKKYGFKVLSDSEKFKDYLNQYYISAFDIPTFEEWKTKQLKEQ